MSNLAEQLMESASAVAALGSAATDIAVLDDASVVAGMALVRDHRRNLQAFELLLSAEITKRSSHEFGNAGLARRHGSPTPAIFIQSITGSSIDEATKLARLGTMVAEAALEIETDGEADSTSATPAVAVAALSGEVSMDAANAIRRGLGRPDNVVTLDHLRAAEQELLAKAGSISPEALLKLARAARGDLDYAAIERGQKIRGDLRYLRQWKRDGMSGGSWALPDEDGGAEIHTALGLALASRAGGPRFPQTDESGNEVVKTAAEIILKDPRSFEQVMVDTFAQIFLNGLHADPSVVPGASRAAVRVIVTEDVLKKQRGSAILEDSLSKITFSKLEEHLCEGGQVGILFDDHGQPLDVGREQRLYTQRQRTALGVRDAGCRYPTCDKPPSWTEAHHIRFWARDKGRTDIADGILLCKPHHMLIHDTESEILRIPNEAGVDTYWLKPGKSLDPNQALIEMPSKNPIVAAMRFAEAG